MEGKPKDTAPGAMMGAIGKAGAIIQALAEGKAVSPDAIATAKQQLLAELHSSSRPKQAEAGDKLGILYRNTKSRQDRWELAGDLLAAGTAGVPVLEREINDHEPLAFLKRIAHMPVGKQLEAVAEFLATFLTPTGRSEKTPGQSGTEPVDWRETAIRQRERKDEDDHGDGPPNLESIIRDSSQPEEDRLNAAKQMGSLAVIPVMDVLCAPQSDADREFAVQALLALSRTEASAAIQRELQVMAASGHRDMAERIQGAMQSVSSAKTAHPTMRPGSGHSSPIPDRWLRRAVDRGDTVGILQAGLGRETLAIRLALRHCAELQAERTEVSRKE